MKTLSTFLVGTLMVFCAWAQEETTVASGPVITFEELAFEHADITQGDVIEHDYFFENTGTEPLIISNVLTTCGCTATKWPREPLAPGAKNSIKVKFNSAGKMGKQTKIITIVSNATEARKQVKLMTNVLPKSEGSK